MRRVKFPFELDATELMTDELKSKVRPLNVRLKLIEKDRMERKRVAKRTKKDNNGDTDNTEMSEEEKQKREEESKELEGLIDPDLKNDIGACSSGLYDLQAILTHKGSDANSGKSLLHSFFYRAHLSTFAELSTRSVLKLTCLCNSRTLHGLLPESR